MVKAKKLEYRLAEFKLEKKMKKYVLVRKKFVKTLKIFESKRKDEP